MKHDITQIFKANNINKVKFYYYKTPLVNNIFTACVFINTNKKQIIARGISICSLRDAHVKSKGRSRSFGRALKATIHKKNYDKIKSKARTDEFITRSIKVKTKKNKEDFKSTIIPELLKINPEMPINISNINNYSIYSFKLPISYPIQETNKSFKYKTCYKPNPVNQKENLLFKEI